MIKSVSKYFNIAKKKSHFNLNQRILKKNLSVSTKILFIPNVFNIDNKKCYLSTKLTFFFLF